MQKLSAFLVVLSIHLSLADWEGSLYGVNITVKQTSGSLRITNGINNLRIDFKEMIELNEAGRPMDTSNGVERNFRGFELQKFDSSATEYIDVIGTPINITAARANFSTTLVGPAAKLTLHISVLDNETLIPDGDLNNTFVVHHGTVKFGFTISDWPFCGVHKLPCDNGEIGKYLDVTIALNSWNVDVSSFSFDRSRGAPGFKAKTYDYGGADVTFSNMYLKNNSWNFLPTGYPKITTKDNANVAVIRFPVFQMPVYYESTVNIRRTNATSSSSVVVTSPSSLFLFMMWNACAILLM